MKKKINKKSQIGSSDVVPFFEMSSVGAVAGFNGPVKKSKKKVKENKLSISNLYEKAVKTDLSKIDSSAAHYLQDHFPEINKVYKDPNKTIEILQHIPEGHGVSSTYKQKLIEKVKELYRISAQKVLEYLYNLYLKGSQLGLTEDKNND